MFSLSVVLLSTKWQASYHQMYQQQTPSIMFSLLLLCHNWNGFEMPETLARYRLQRQMVDGTLHIERGLLYLIVMSIHRLPENEKHISSLYSWFEEILFPHRQTNNLENHLQSLFFISRSFNSKSTNQEPQDEPQWRSNRGTNPMPSLRLRQQNGCDDVREIRRKQTLSLDHSYHPSPRPWVAKCISEATHHPLTNNLSGAWIPRKRWTSDWIAPERFRAWDAFI